MKNKKSIFTANVFGIEKPVRATAEKLIQLLEAKAYEARREKDERLAHYFWQHAEHYKRI